MNDEQFAELLDLKHELLNVEFKPPGLRTDRLLFHLVARAAIGMANRRDGGRVVIGVRETAGKFERVGLTAEELESWRYEHLADALAPLTDPPVIFDVDVRSYKNMAFVLVEVTEFEDVPIICRRNYPRSVRHGEKRILRKGGLYVRPRRKPETSEVEDQADLRDLLDLATEKRLQRLLGTVSRAGGNLIGGPSADLAFLREQTGEAGLEPAHAQPEDFELVEPAHRKMSSQAATEAFLSELPDDFK